MAVTEFSRAVRDKRAVARTSRAERRGEGGTPIKGKKCGKINTLAHAWHPRDHRKLSHVL